MSSPVLDTSGVPSLGTIFEGTADPAGVTVARLVIDGSITTAGGGAGIEAVAVTGARGYTLEAFMYSVGDPQYSVDGGATWNEFPWQIDGTGAWGLLLRPTDMVRVLPGPESSGTLTQALTFRAWDGSHGTAGQVIAMQPEMDGFSNRSEDATAIIAAVNDAPVLSLAVGTVTGNLTRFEDEPQGIFALPDGRILVGISGGVSLFAVAQLDADGTLDTGFGGGGVAVTQFGSDTTLARAMAVQPDGKVVLQGITVPQGEREHFALVRYGPNGAPDTSFGGTGTVVTPMLTGNFSFTDAQGVAVQPDGKIIAAGVSTNGANYDFLLIRLLADGTPDPSFGVGGRVSTDFGGADDTPYALALQADGKIVAVGSSIEIAPGLPSTVRIARYDADGVLDATFGTHGVVDLQQVPYGTKASAVVVQPDGKIIVTGWSDAETRFDLMRINPDGTPDHSFGADGVAALDLGAMAVNNPDSWRQDNSVYLQADGKYLVAGSSSAIGDAVFLARFNVDGSVDTGFGAGAGYVRISVQAWNSASGIAQQADGRILVTGSAVNQERDTVAYVARFNVDGSPDATFGCPVFTQGGPAVVLDPRVHVNDRELRIDNFAGATLTLARHGGAQPDDFFQPSGNVSVSGDAVLLSGEFVARYTYDGGVLVVTFESSATNDKVNQLMSSIAYGNRSDAPPTSIEMDWTFSDGNTGAQGIGGALASTGTSTVNIVGVAVTHDSHGAMLG
ncbi:MAG: hypothetical protein V4787_06065 [Pseudomonadota bacterium]